jgi:hypothetical protein
LVSRLRRRVSKATDLDAAGLSETESRDVAGLNSPAESSDVQELHQTLVQSCDQVDRELAAALDSWRQANDAQTLRASLARVIALLDA